MNEANRNNSKGLIIGLALVTLTGLMLLLKLAPNSPWQSMSWWFALAPVWVPICIYVVMLVAAIVGFIFHSDLDDR